MEISGGKFVITGGASLIGSHVADRLLAKGAGAVVLLDNFSLGTPETVRHLDGDARVSLVKGDILRVGELYDALKGADGVFAIAGFLTLPLSQNPPLGLAVNVEGQVNTFEACRFAGVRKVIFSSSIAAYGEPEGDALIDETAPANLASYQPGSMLCASSTARSTASMRSRCAMQPSMASGSIIAGSTRSTSSRIMIASCAANAPPCPAMAARCTITSTSPMWRGRTSWRWPRTSQAKF